MHHTFSIALNPSQAPPYQVYRRRQLGAWSTYGPPNSIGGSMKKTETFTLPPAVVRKGRNTRPTAKHVDRKRKLKKEGPPWKQ